MATNGPITWPSSNRTPALVFFGGAYLYGITVDGQWTKSCAPAWDDKFEATVEKRLADLTPIA